MGCGNNSNKDLIKVKNEGLIKVTDEGSVKLIDKKVIDKKVRKDHGTGGTGARSSK